MTEARDLAEGASQTRLGLGSGDGETIPGYRVTGEVIKGSGGSEWR